jgi:HSP20 family protein
MSLARWDPLIEMRRMREDLDRLFGSSPHMSMLVPWIAEGVAPAVDVFEKGDNVTVKINLPGLKKDDVEVTATEDSVSVSGEFKKEEEVKEAGFHRRERQLGRFFRTIPMPTAIKPDAVKASFKNGVLDITAPKAKAGKAKEKKVPIEV